MRVCVEQKGPLTAPNPQGGKKVPTWGRDGCPNSTERAEFPQLKKLHMFNGKSKYIIRPIKTTTYHKILHYNLTIWWKKNFYSKQVYKKNIYTHIISWSIKGWTQISPKQISHSIFSPGLWRGTFKFPSHPLSVSLTVTQIPQEEHKSPDSSQRQREAK